MLRTLAGFGESYISREEGGWGKEKWERVLTAFLVVVQVRLIDAKPKLSRQLRLRSDDDLWEAATINFRDSHSTDQPRIKCRAHKI
jgi:hypothetical protein